MSHGFKNGVDEVFQSLKHLRVGTLKVLDKTKKKTRSKKKKRDTNKSSDSSVSRSRRETANMSVNNVMSSIKLPKKLNLFLGQHNGDNFLAFFDLSGQKTLKNFHF